MRGLHRVLAPVCVLLLTACAGHLRRPAKPLPPSLGPAIPTTTQVPGKFSVPGLPTGVWARMRARFTMPGCDASPDIAYWARRFTQRPRRFEHYLREHLPTVVYVEHATEKAHVAAEFTFLPWVESRYRAVPPWHHRSAGMWQIVPITARTLKLPIEHDYDGRLDRIAATAAVMKMLRSYHRRWQDWRLVDMAYNAGQYRIRSLHPQGPAPAKPAIPDLAVSRITHEHLAKLLGMACVVRNPSRFHVHLPAPDPSRRLTEVDLPYPVTLDAIAHASGASRTQVRNLNAAYLHGRMPGNGPWHVLLPEQAATKLRAAIAAAALPRQPATYTVVPGDSLWQIAHRHGLSVGELRRLNHLHSNTLHPGQVLFIETGK
ncbi:LysM peptidoglycan-binding domain-containing protein [Oleiagrimonas sp.]|jgi:membrane-bound lytic murein transglycosylase D|uniref:LysM peptidoglycan-binding domain-containing protein n=1 Tax=Oleiagrimonas sp. TaxID=2010330 RepID=UPI002621D11D|nr:LysM peptidoglycan-binding domain-containing protein [Oleiagrimonas sp.]MDA3913202.1 LysM peptidoglycan-binding domain-containing protein [Oleiagrimonas sp.]